MRLLGSLKRRLIPPGSRPRRLRGGLNRGLRMALDLHYDTQRWLGLYEREIASAVQELSRGARVACDVGAHDGYYTLFLLHRARVPRVLSFEPSAVGQAGLARNLALSPAPPGTELVVSAERVGRSGVEGGVSLDAVLAEATPPFFFKVDVEGDELALLQGAERILAERAGRWILETHSPQLEADCQQLLEASGHATEVVDAAWWRALVPEQRPSQHCRWLIARPRSGQGNALP